MGPFLLVAAVAAGATAAVTPAVVRLANRLGAVDQPSDPRKVHTGPIPSLGGLAILFGFVAALGVAFLLPDFRDVFTKTSEPLGLLLGVAVIAAVGLLDDLKGLPVPVKVAGQILAAMGPVLFGIQIVYAWIPGLDVVAVGPDLGFVLTVVAIVAMVNAVNLIDGLDGLAAGVVAIGALAFFIYAHISEAQGITEATLPTAAPLVAAILFGVCVGFLLHNFHPATIFMGDTGSMTLGLLLGAAGVAHVGRSTAPGYAEFAGSVPLLTPALVLAIPFADTAFAVARRAYQRRPITVADSGHLHHLLIAFGHSHRRAVLILYYWSAVLAFATVGLTLLPAALVVAGLTVTVLIGAALTVAGVRSGPAARRPARGRRAG